MNILFVIAWRELRARGWTKSANGLIALVLAIGVLGNAGHPFSAAGLRGIGRTSRRLQLRPDGTSVPARALARSAARRSVGGDRGARAVEAVRHPARNRLLRCAVRGVARTGRIGQGDEQRVVPGSLAKPWVGARESRAVAPEAVVMGAGMMLAHFHRG